MKRSKKKFSTISFNIHFGLRLIAGESVIVRMRVDGFLSIEIAYGFCMRPAYTVESFKYGASMVIPEPSRLGDSRILITRQKW